MAVTIRNKGGLLAPRSVSLAANFKAPANSKPKKLDPDLNKRIMHTPYNVLNSLIATNINLNPDPIIQHSDTKGLALYREMMLHPIVYTGKRIRDNAWMSLPWGIESAGATPEDTQRREHVADAFARMSMRTHTQDVDKPAFREFMKAAGEKRWYGVKWIEAVWNLSEGRIVEVIPHIHQVFQWGSQDSPNYSPDGLWTGDTLWFRRTAHDNYEKAPAYRIMSFIHNPENANPYGTSDLQPAYWPWWGSFINVWRFWIDYLERFGHPNIAAHLPIQLFNDDEFMPVLEQAMASFMTEAVTKFPVNPNNNEHIVELFEPSGRASSVASFDQFMRRMEQWIMLVLVGNVLSTMEAEFGSRAQAQTHERRIDDYTAADIVAMQDAMQIPIQWMVDIKYGKPAWKQQAEISGQQISKKDQKILESLYPRLELFEDDSIDLESLTKRYQILAQMTDSDGKPFVPLSQVMQDLGVKQRETVNDPESPYNGQLEPAIVMPQPMKGGPDQQPAKSSGASMQDMLDGKANMEEVVMFAEQFKQQADSMIRWAEIVHRDVKEQREMIEELAARGNGHAK